MKQYLLAAAISCCISIADAQNVGIGLSNPSEKLQVAGNIKADTIKPSVMKIVTNAGDGKVLTSDALGNASWKTAAVSSSGNFGYGVWGDCATNAAISDYQPAGDETGTTSDNFGEAVAIFGDYAIVGARFDNVQTGSASIFHFDGTRWQYLQKLTDASGEGGDQFGFSVAISANYAVVGAPFDDNTAVSVDRGSASVYQLVGGNWVFMQKLGVGSAGDRFGYSVSVFNDMIAAGAPRRTVGSVSGQGTVYTYRFNSTSWVVATLLTEPSGSTNAELGTVLQISGNTLIVGAPFDDVDVSSTSKGSASIFIRTGNSWSFSQKLTELGGASNNTFGRAVCISGNLAIIGSPLDDHATISNAGSAHVYRYNGTTWEYIQRITDIDAAAADQFGISVAMSGNYILVGCSTADINGRSNQGKAILFATMANAIIKVQTIIDPAGDAEDRFSSTVTIDSNKRFAVGAYGFNVNMGKVVFGKVN